MDLKPGSRWRSAVCEAEVVVVRAPKVAANLFCGDQPMVAQGSPPPSAAAPTNCSEGPVAGKRYMDPESGLEVLCTRSGSGALQYNSRLLSMAEAKKLPASD